MEILENQYLSVESLLLYKTRTTYKKLGLLIKHLDNNLSLLGFKKTGNTIFTLTENRYGNDEPIIDVEIMIPVEESFKSNEYYVYKPRVVLANALKLRCSYNYCELYEARNKIQKYIFLNSYIPITNYYYKLISNGIQEVFDIYISINENIL